MLRSPRPLLLGFAGLVAVLTACLDAGPDEPDPDLGTDEAAVVGPGDGDPDACINPTVPTLTLQGTTATTANLVAGSTCSNATATLERRLGTTGTFVQVASGFLFGVTYTDRNLAAQTSYCWRASARISTRTATSAIRCGTTRMTPPAAVSSLRAFAITRTTLRLTFLDQATNEDGFRLYRLDGTQWLLERTIPTANRAGSRFYDVDLAPSGWGNGDGTYCYVVATYNADNQAWGPEACAKLQTHTAGPPLGAYEWSFTHPTPQPWPDITNPRLPRKAGRLHNSHAGANLGYSARSWGVSLGWTSGDGNLELERAPGSSLAPIVDSERVALKVPGGGYLRYEQRNWGINLGFSAVPQYEWRLRQLWSTPSLEGYPVDRGFALCNEVAADCMVHGDRANGVSLRWFRDTLEPAPAPPPAPVVTTTDVWLTAGNQGGWVVWQGTHASTYGGEIEAIEVVAASNLQGFFFLKDNAGGERCVTADSSSGVFVAAGAMMTEGQKLALWSTARPTLPRTFRGCACFGGTCQYVPAPGVNHPVVILDVRWAH